jgi:hypothetical protein
MAHEPGDLTDVWHVISDALGELLDQIDRTEACPWEQYDSEPDDDPKTTEDGYLSVLRQAQAMVVDVLNGRGRSERLRKAMRSDAVVISRQEESLAVWFTPLAIREHFAIDGEPHENPTNEFTDEELAIAAEIVMGGSDFLWATYDSECDNVLAYARRIKTETKEGF